MDAVVESTARMVDDVGLLSSSTNNSLYARGNVRVGNAEREGTSTSGVAGVTREDDGQNMFVHKSASSPALKHLASSFSDTGGIVGCGEDSASNHLEVYVVLRNFQEFGGGFFHRLPEPLRDGLRDSGVCHYMTVFKHQDGTLTQFDFGPAAGGDIHISAPGPLGRVLNKNASRRREKRVIGQVREKTLNSLPDAHMFVGTTDMSLADVRAWNTVHAAPEYELHRSDCRHYVNALVSYTTGIERAAISALRHQLARDKDRKRVGSQMIRIGQYFTDAANWDRVCAIGHAMSAALMTLAGQQTLARLGAAPLLQSVGAKLVPSSARGALVPVKRALFHRPVYAMSTAAVASTMAASTNETLTLRSAPIATIRSNVVRTVQTCVRAAASLADNVGKTARASQQSASRAMSHMATSIVQATHGRRMPMLQESARLHVTPRGEATANSQIRSSSKKVPGYFSSSSSSHPKRAMQSSSGIFAGTGAAVQHLALIATRR
jgi:hypothetical protein